MLRGVSCERVKMHRGVEDLSEARLAERAVVAEGSDLTACTFPAELMHDAASKVSSAGHGIYIYTVIHSQMNENSVRGVPARHDTRPLRRVDSLHVCRPRRTCT